MKLDRGMGLVGATSTNVIGMIGVGPFLTLPFMITAMRGPHILYAWIIGAVLALCDGLVYAQLAAALPGSGGPYVYLREAYRPLRLGGVLSFLFIFQIVLVAPLSIASGAVGFADYLGFYWRTMTPLQHDLVAACLCIGMTALLFRSIASAARLSVILLVVVLVTVGWVIVAGLFNFSLTQAFAFPPEAFHFDKNFVATTGAVSLLAMYNYGGYNNVCNIGDEIREPTRTMPRAIVVSIVLVVTLYVLMSTVILGLVPWQEAEKTRTIASLFIGRTFSDPGHGRIAAIVMTGLILIVTASSIYAIILGYSRIPYAAARDGQFFRIFARVHPTKHVPHVSLLVLGGASIPFCFFSLGRIVNWLVLVQVILQYVWQCAGVILLARLRRDVAQPFRMWLFPLPALVALGMWGYVFFSAALEGMLFAVGFGVVGVLAYFVFRRTGPKPSGSGDDEAAVLARDGT